MSAKDVIHTAVKNALIKDEWIITHDPYTIQYKDKYAYADLAAERILLAEKGSEKIVVEVKSFVGYSILQDFKEMLGQHLLYSFLLAETSPEYKLFVAVDFVTYDSDFQHPMIQLTLEQSRISLIVVDTIKEEIVQWIS